MLGVQYHLLFKTPNPRVSAAVEMYPWEDVKIRYQRVNTLNPLSYCEH